MKKFCLVSFVLLLSLLSSCLEPKPEDIKNFKESTYTAGKCLHLVVYNYGNRKETDTEGYFTANWMHPQVAFEINIKPIKYPLNECTLYQQVQYAKGRGLIVSTGWIKIESSSVKNAIDFNDYTEDGNGRYLNSTEYLVSFCLMNNKNERLSDIVSCNINFH